MRDLHDSHLLFSDAEWIQLVCVCVCVCVRACVRPRVEHFWYDTASKMSGVAAAEETDTQRHRDTHRHRLRETHHLASLGLETGGVGSRAVYEQGRRGGGGGLYCCLLLLRYCGWQRGCQPLLLHLLLQLLHSFHLWEERRRGAERARARDKARERERATQLSAGALETVVCCIRL